jgi:hypothetical protein
MMITFKFKKKEREKKEIFDNKRKKHPQKVDMMESINIEYPKQMQKVNQH